MAMTPNIFAGLNQCHSFRSSVFRNNEAVLLLQWIMERRGGKINQFYTKINLQYHFTFDVWKTLTITDSFHKASLALLVKTMHISVSPFLPFNQNWWKLSWISFVWILLCPNLWPGTWSRTILLCYWNGNLRDIWTRSYKFYFERCFTFCSLFFNSRTHTHLHIKQAHQKPFYEIIFKNVFQMLNNNNYNLLFFLFSFLILGKSIFGSALEVLISMMNLEHGKYEHEKKHFRPEFVLDFFFRSVQMRPCET